MGWEWPLGSSGLRVKYLSQQEIVVLITLSNYEGSGPSMLAYIKYGCRGTLKPKIRPLALLGASARAFKEVFFANLISRASLFSNFAPIHIFVSLS